MKASVLLAVTLSAAPFAVAAEVPVGATLAEVHATLGRPSGQLRAGGRHLLYFERGSVELVNDRVASVTLRTPDEQAARDAREERVRGEAEARRAEIVTTGTELRDRKLADAAFQGSPVAYQVAFWEDFARRYPGVTCAEPLAIARLKLRDQLEEKARKAEEARRIAELEERVAAAEQARDIYRIRSYPRYGYGQHYRSQEFALWPVKYTFYDSPKPAYETPGSSPVSSFRGNLAQPERRDYQPNGRDRGQDDDDGRRDWRSGDRGRGYRRERM